MEAFVKRHQDKIAGVLSGFDRVLFRGTLRSISYAAGLDKFLGASGVLLKDFGEFSKRCTEQIADGAQKLAADAGRPFIYLESSSICKEDRARQIAERDNIRQGLVCVLYAVEPCASFEIYRNRHTKHIELRPRHRKCRFFYFYYIDREFGLMHVRLQSWIPFQIQVCINGRSYLAKQMDREGIGYERQGNCFPRIDDLPRAQALLDRLTRRAWVKTLSRFARRVNPLLSGPLSNVHDYYWTVRQSEVATDVMFHDAAGLADIYPDLCQHAIMNFSTNDVMRFLGRRTMAGRPPQHVTSRINRRVEGVRVKHAVNGNSIKMYDKAGSILRIEVTINDPYGFRVLRQTAGDGKPALAWQKMRKGVCDTPRRVEVSLAANGRYLEALSVVGERTPSCQILDSVSRRVRKAGYRYRALRPISPEDSRILRAVMHGEHLIHGFTNQQLQLHLYDQPPRTKQQRRRRSAYISRTLRLLRAHGLIRKVANRNLYRITPRGHRVMATATLFRQTDPACLARKAS